MAGKRLVTEEDVRRMAPGGVLRLDSGTIATPSALDAAHERGIRVQRGGAPAPAATAGPSKAACDAPRRECLWHAMLEQDGTYVVQVVNGRAQVTRLENTGPVPFGTDSVQDHHA